MADDSAIAERKTTALERLYEDAGSSVERAGALESEILEGRVESAEQLSSLLGISLTYAKKILSSEKVQNEILECFRAAELAELDLMQISELKVIAKNKKLKPGPRIRAMNEMRNILTKREKGGPLVQFNQQINQHFPDGSIESFIKNIDKPK